MAFMLLTGAAQQLLPFPPVFLINCCQLSGVGDSDSGKLMLRPEDFGNFDPCAEVR